MKIFTKESLKAELRQIRERGWVNTTHRGSDGGVGNTLESLLGIEENNLPLPNAGEWEIKVQRKETSSHITLFHMEPSPRAIKFVPQILLPNYGWEHKEAGRKYPSSEMSFRQTISATRPTNRGFSVKIDYSQERIEMSFDPYEVDSGAHSEWLASVEERAGLDGLEPQPYWGFEDLFHKAGTKLHKTVYAIAECRRSDDAEQFHFTDFYMLEHFSKKLFLRAIKRGDILIDFDARTGHNHGTKFRLKQSAYRSLYNSVEQII